MIKCTHIVAVRQEPQAEIAEVFCPSSETQGKMRDLRAQGYETIFIFRRFTGKGGRSA